VYATTTLSSSTYYCYQVTDSSSAGPESSGSAWDLVTVNPDPTAVQSPSTTQSNESGQINNFVVIVTGGTAAYTYVWLVNGTDGSSLGVGAYTSHYAFHPQHPASYVVNVAVTDAANWHTWTTSVTETTYPGPEVSMTASATNIDLGGTVNYVGSESGGVPPISYAWYLNGTLIPGQSLPTWSFTPAGAAVYSIMFSATDADHAQVTNTSVLTVYANPIVSVPVASPSSVDLTQPTTFTTVAQYGSGGYTFAWSGLPGGCSGTTPSISCTPSGTGTYTVTVKITDSNGHSATSGPLTFIVYADPSITSPVTNRTSADVGQAVWFNTTLTGAGSGGDAYWWAGLPAGCTNSSVAALGPCSVSSVGTFTVIVKIRDSNGYVFTGGSVVFRVYSDPTASAPTPVPITVDVGQWVNFSTSTSGGWKGPFFTWFNLPTGCLSANVTTLACDPAGNGLFNVGVGVKDANGMWVESSTLSFTVYTAPSAATPTFAPSAFDLTQSTIVSTTPNGGLGPYSYTWAGLPGGCSSVAASFSCTPLAAGSYSITVMVTDSNGRSATSPVAVLTVNPDPMASQYPSTLQTNESGQVNLFTANVTLGTAPYTYQWMVNGTAVTGATLPVFAFHPVYPANYTVNFTVVDSAGWRLWTPAVVESVFPGPHISFSASVPTIDLRSRVTFTGAEHGGAAPFTYTWFLNRTIAQIGPSITWNFTPYGAAVYNVTLRVTDVNLAYVNSTWLLFTVYADPIVGDPVATPASVDLGQSTTFNVIASFGSGGFSYSWADLPSGCTGSLDTFSCVPGAAGQYYVSVTVTDSNGISAASGTLAFTVFADPTISTPVTSRISVDTGQIVNFTTSGGAGSGGDTYVWMGLPVGCSSQNSAQISCIPSASSTYVIKVKVTDSNDFSVTSGSLSFTVYSIPTVSAPTATPATIDIGRSATFSVVGASGSGGFTYVWSGLPTGCMSNDSASITCAPSLPGSYNISVKVTDSNHYSVDSATLSFTVHILPTVTLASNVKTIDVGTGIVLNLSILGGVGPFTASWTLNGSAWSLPTGTFGYTFYPTGAGTYTFSVMVTDSLGGNSTSATPVTVTVNARLQVAVVVNPTNILLGSTALFNGSVSGGTTPLSYQWYVNGALYPTASGIQLSYIPAAAGTYTVTLTVSDGAGQHATSSPVTITVTAPPPPPSKQPGSILSYLESPFVWILIVLAIAVILIIVLVRRRHKEEKPSAQAEMAVAGATAAAEGASLEGPEGVTAPPVEPEMASPGYTPETSGTYAAEAAPGEIAPEVAPEVLQGAAVVAGSATATPEGPVEAPREEAAPPVQEAAPAQPAPPEAGESSDNLFDAILASAGFEVPHQAAPPAPKRGPKVEDEEAAGAPPEGPAPPTEMAAPIPTPPASTGPRCPRCGQPLPSADSQCLACELDKLNETIDAPPHPAQTQETPPEGNQASSGETELPKICLFCKKPLEPDGFCTSCNINWSALSNV
jgi:PKD repeat protein